MKSRKSVDSPQIFKDDSLNVEVVEHPFKFKHSKNEKLTKLITNSVNLMGALGEDAEKDYKRSLTKLRTFEKEAIITIGKEYFDLEERQYLDRWSLVQLLSDLHAESTLPYFEKIISKRIPKEKSKDPHSFTTVGEETLIRIAAIEGLVNIGKNYKSKNVLEILLDNVNHKNFSIKRTSIQGYLELGGKNARAILLKKLKKRNHHILKIRKVNVKEVPQATGGLFLKSNDTDSLPKLKNK